jgi:DNA gyrase/topoisomerase IV subunit B
MYVGDPTNGSGLHALLWEVVSEVLEQHAQGYASELQIELGPDGWISVRDDGPGLPTELVPSRHAPPRTALELMFTQLSCGSGRRRLLTDGMHGVGFAAVNALCEELVVETTYRGVRWSMGFERGDCVSPLRRLGPTRVEGTMLRFRPDPTIFPSIALDQAAVRERLQAFAWLHPHLRVWFQERRLWVRGGIDAWARDLASERGEVIETLTAAQHVGSVRVDSAFAWTRDGAPRVRTFVNGHATASGSHIDGMWLGFAEHARAHGSPARRVAHVREAIGAGMVAIIRVQMSQPRFTSMARESLRSLPAANVTRAAVQAALRGDDGYTWNVRRFVEQRLLIR